MTGGHIIHLNKGRSANLIIKRNKMRRFHTVAAPYRVVLNPLRCGSLIKMT